MRINSNIEMFDKAKRAKKYSYPESNPLIYQVMISNPGHR